MIKGALSYIDKDSLLVLYKSFVRPYLEYCVQARSYFLVKDKNILEKMQRRATKLVPELQYMLYEDRLSSLGLTTLEDRHIRGDMTEMYKILHGVESVPYNAFFVLRNCTGLRSHFFCVQVERSRLNVRKKFFSKRSVAIWNSLPQHVVTSPIVNAFKVNYDNYRSATTTF